MFLLLRTTGIARDDANKSDFHDLLVGQPMHKTTGRDDMALGYYERAIHFLKESRPADIEDFRVKYAAGALKLELAQRIFRLMSIDEARAWNRLSPPGATRINPSSMRSLFGLNSQYNSKWFSFDRTYLFGRQQINQQGGREGQNYLMILPITHEIRNSLLKKMLPDVRMDGFDDDLKRNSSRVKVEGGTITLGIPLPLLEKMACHMTIESIGARPQLVRGMYPLIHVARQGFDV